MTTFDTNQDNFEQQKRVTCPIQTVVHMPPELFNKVYNKLLSNSKDLDPKYSQIVTDNFDELLAKPI
jgi:hypothetical protein